MHLYAAGGVRQTAPVGLFVHISPGHRFCSPFYPCGGPPLSYCVLLMFARRTVLRTTAY